MYCIHRSRFPRKVKYTINEWTWFYLDKAEDTILTFILNFFMLFLTITDKLNGQIFIFFKETLRCGFYKCKKMKINQIRIFQDKRYYILLVIQEIIEPHLYCIHLVHLSVPLFFCPFFQQIFPTHFFLRYKFIFEVFFSPFLLVMLLFSIL